VHVISALDFSHSAREMGAVGYLQKPVEHSALVRALSELAAKIGPRVRRVLLVEHELEQQRAIAELLSADDVETVCVGDAPAALAQLRAATFDCMVLDVHLPDGAGFELLERMAQQDVYAFPPVIVYPSEALSADEEERLRSFSRSIVVKGARSPERLLDEVSLFLHQVEAKLPPARRRMLQVARDRDALLEGRRILVVEDDVRNVFALSHMLEEQGARVDVARNGREALDRLDVAPAIDLVLMDIMMPEMDGLTATREIRKRASGRKLPIIALTAQAMRNDQERCLQAGASDYVAKPIDVDKLLSLIRVWMPK
jgi:CheY-like chemotaxis protein